MEAEAEHTADIAGGASPPPYDPLLPTPSTAHLRASPTNQVTRNANPVSMDTPTETPHDLFCLAKEYERRGRLPDAANLYLKASMNGHLSAMVSYAAHLVPTDERAAFVWFRAAAERGDPRAWAELGQLLACGRYFEVNAIDAARCWKRAAQMGDNTGKSALGLCYIRGFGVKQDAEKGIEIVRQVADVHNDVTAMKNLAWIYRNGKGVPKNLDEAEYWDGRAKKHEKVMAHITSREQVLFGRGRFSRHSKYKTRDPERSAPRPPPRDAPITEPERTDTVSAVHVQEDPTRHRERHSKPAVLVEEDLQNRLRGVSEDPSRHSPESLEHKAPVAATVPDTANLETRPVESEVSEEAAPPLTEANTESRQEHTGRPVAAAAAVGATAAAVGATTAAVGATTAAALGRPDHTRPETVVQQVREQDPELEQRAFEGFKATSKKPDPELGAAVEDLNFTPADPEETVAAAAERFELPESEIKAVQQTASARAAQAAQLEESTPSRDDFYNQPTEGRVENTEQLAETTAEPVEGSTEDQFNTPDQSLHDEGDDSPGLLKPASVAVAGTTAGLGVAQSHRQVVDESSRPVVGTGDEPRANLTGSSVPTRTVEHSEEPEGTFEPLEQGEEGIAETGIAGIPGGAGDDEIHPLGPGVKSRAMFFEKSAVAAELKAAEEKVPAVRRGNSYALDAAATNAFSGAHQGNEDLDEFEQADMQRVTSEGPESRPTYTAEGPIACKITRASRFSKDGQGRSQRALDAASYGGYGGDKPTYDKLRDLLALYPKNPLRADSQVPLFNLVNAIQRFPISDTEAYNILEKGNGFSKIIVAMLSQHEDEFLQEQGLHAFMRAVRATPSSQRENLVLSSYADCYRNVQGNMDVVVPKGPLGIDERSSGAIQAIVQAMRHHASVRRVQLAGCAALGEVASISSSCRSIAYDHGAITLIITCLRHRSSQAACTIHDIACRAISSFCSGKENFAFKEAFTSAGAVTELLNILQLWGHAEDVSSELLTTVTKNCLISLRHVTDGCTVASEQCVTSFAYHHLVRVMVLRRDDVSVCTQVVSVMAAITRSAGAVAEKELQDSKPLPEVLVTMQEHSEQPLFIRKALDFMEALGNFSSMKEEIVVAGGIPFATDIVQQGGNDSLLLERACGVVEKLCRSNSKNQEILLSNNGIMSLTSLLKTHQGLPGVLERALLALTSACASNAKTQKEAVKVGTPDQVLRSLGSYSAKNSKVVAASTSTMAAMVVPRNAAMAQSFAKLKAPELVVRAMKRHPDSVMVQENGSAAIASFCEADPRIISLLLKSGISSILVVALQRYLHKQTAVVQIVRAMRAISNEASEDSYRFKAKLLTDRSNESSLSEIFHTALAYHKKSLPETANVIISICATINRLCMRSVAFKNEVGKDGIVEELKKLAEKTAEFRDLGALQPVLATICTLVLDSEDNKNRFHAVGGVETILVVMQKWKSDTYVLEHCCAALRYSCNDHFGNCDEVKRHNGVRSILGVMELHPENVNVTLWCCLTLADLCKGDEELQSSPNVVQGIRKVVSAMSMFSNNSRFLASACEFLRAASLDNEDNQVRIVRLGGRTAIVKALEAHPGDNTLTESGAYALLQVQDVQDARTSVDSQPQMGLVKRLSRELRRTGSGSNRSSGKGGGLLGRKSRSFSSRRKPTARPEDEEPVPLNQTVAEENPATRPSLINFSRGARSRSRKAKAGAAQVEEPKEGPPGEGEQFTQGADDGYGEHNPVPVEGHESDAQID